jgi:hypothetical protein
MKAIHFLAAAVLGFASSAYAADKHDHGHEHKPLHGGVVIEVKDMDYEFVAKSDRLQLYLRDHGKAVDVSKASAKVTLLAGTEKQEVELKPTGDKLEAAGSFKVAAGTKAIALVSLPGKPAITVRFALK